MEKAKHSFRLILPALILLPLVGCGGGLDSVVSKPATERNIAAGRNARAAATATGVQPQRPQRPAYSPSALTVSLVVLTTDDQKNLMATQPTFNFTSATAVDEHVVIVDESQKFQQIEGFGAAFTDSSCYLLNEVATSSARTAAMTRLFTRINDGIGLSFMRTPMGASDLARSMYSYDDMPSGQTDVNLTNFSIAHDQVDVIPIILQAKQLNPQMKLMASPWSPPGWMKTSSSLVGGSLKPDYYQQYSNYFVKYLQAYAAAGVAVDYLSLQNEPQYQPSDYPGMLMDAATQTTLVRDYFLPAFQTSGLNTRLLIWDHNWDNTAFPDAELTDTTLLNSEQVAGIAWHWYAGTPGSMTTLRNKYPTKDNHVTEASGGTWIGDEVQTDFETIIQAMRNWSKSYVKWGLALDQNRGPHTGGCGTCTPLVTVNSTTGNVTYPIDFYTLGHFSRFVVPGATRIYSSNATGIISAAFVNPDGSKVLVAFNDASTSNAFQVGWGNQSFAYTLPALSGVTFTWSGTQTGTYAISAQSKIQASSYTDVYGLQTENCTDTNRGYDLGYSADGYYAYYKNVAFGTGVGNVDARVASNGSGGTLEFHLDSPTGPAIGSVTIPVTGGWQTWTTVSGSVSGATGLRDLYVVFKGTTSIGNLNWFSFRS